MNWPWWVVVALVVVYGLQFGAYHQGQKEACNERGGVYIMQQSDCQIPKPSK
jgi:hypothetical protein